MVFLSKKLCFGTYLILNEYTSGKADSVFIIKIIKFIDANQVV